MSYSFTRAITTQEAWRALDHALAQWVVAHGGSSMLASVAAWTSFADGVGDTAIALRGDEAGRHGMPLLSDEDIEALRREPMVSDGNSATPTPFVMDVNGRFSLWRNYSHEVRVAAQVAARLTPASGDVHALSLDDVDALFQGDRSIAVQRQRDAVERVVGRKFFVLTGGPGTGKTTTVLRMLLMLQRQSAEALTIQVAAPTGKAAQRLVESLRQGKKKLVEGVESPLAGEWQEYLNRIPDTEALTVHRLLAFNPRRNRFARSAKFPIAADVVVIDEASMVDLAMLRALMDAVRPDATLILVGDPDQLTSVAAGSALMDLVAALDRSAAPELVRLEHSFRAEQHLVPINRAVREGNEAALKQAFAAAGVHARHDAIDSPAKLRKQLDRWAEELSLLPLRPVLASTGRSRSESSDDRRVADAIGALRALSRQQLLCALREDGFGALSVNSAIEQRLRRHWGVAADQVWYPGRAIIITRNDYAARLFNGDVGIALADETGVLQVWFETTLADGRASARAFAPGTLPPHDGAFALTIHKSQGSEYSRAAVLLPPDAEHRILSRQLLYTGLSRAKQDVELWSAPDSLSAALSQVVRRAGGLEARLAEALGTR
jgi:exodeoxyribonuclease V alpha subunit